MKLNRLTVHNFRQFCGQQRLTFSSSRECNVTVVHGANGAGKTSLFTAINWCLYGAGTESMGSLINKEAVIQAASGATIQASVELTFTHEGEQFVATRTISADKRRDALLVDGSPEFSLMRIAVSGQAEKVNGPMGVLNAILSPKVRTYFFFDGEKIDNFAKPDASGEVRGAVHNVLRLERLERGRYHLGEAAATLRREWKKTATSDVTHLLDEEIAKREEVTKIEGRQDELKGEIASTRRHLDDIANSLRELEASRHLQGTLDLLQRQLEGVRHDREELVGQIRNDATGGYVALVGDAIAKATSLIDEKRSRGEVPSGIREQLLHDLLDRLVCICARPFQKGDAVYHHLEDMLTVAVPRTLEDDVLNTHAALRQAPTQATELRARLNGAIRRKVQLDEQYDAINAEASDVRRQFRVSDQDEIQGLGRSQERYEADWQDYQVQLGMNKNKIETLTREIEDVVKRRKKAEAAQEQNRLMGRKIELAQSAADALQQVYLVYAEDMRQRIEAKAQGILDSLVWKENQFTRLSLDADYKLEVYDRWGQPARADFSAGERQVLSLAFIMAMAKVSEREAPLVMDTPFGRLSSGHRENITATVPEMADQLVLFVTDEELRERSLANLRPRIGVEYQLAFDDLTGCTTIEEVG